MLRVRGAGIYVCTTEISFRSNANRHWLVLNLYPSPPPRNPLSVSRVLDFCETSLCPHPSACAFLFLDQSGRRFSTVRPATAEIFHRNEPPIDPSIGFRSTDSVRETVNEAEPLVGSYAIARFPEKLRPTVKRRLASGERNFSRGEKP